MSEDLEYALCVVYSAFVLALILLGHRQASNLVTGAFTAGLSVWRLWRPHRGEAGMAAAGYTTLLAGGLITLVLSIPWPL